MSANNTKYLAIGLLLLVTFFVVLVAIFMPLFEGDNALNYLDNLYNSISKGSAYYIPKVQQQIEQHGPLQVELALTFDDASMAAAAVPLLRQAGATATAEGGTLQVRGDLEAVFSQCLQDAESGYHNRDQDLEARYGIETRAALFTWWKILGAMEKNLNRQKLFDAAHLTHTVQARTVECAYNYYGIEAQEIKDRWVTVLLSLVFYVLYTVWYGYGIMYTFEGLGFRLSAH